MYFHKQTKLYKVPVRTLRIILQIVSGKLHSSARAYKITTQRHVTA